MVGETKLAQPLEEAISAQKASACQAQEAAEEDQNGHNDHDERVESGEGELEPDEDTPPQASGRAPRKREEFWSSAPQIQEGCRRGASSLRLRHTDAYESCTFPDYPETMPPGDYEMPRELLDNSAPPSARKWELCLDLMAQAKDLAAKRQAAHERLVHGQALAQREAAGHEEFDNKRVRRPTAIMRQNVEVARMMGVPGTKQKHMNADAIVDEEKPQHLSTSRPRDRATQKAGAPERPKQPNQYTYAGGTAASGACNGGGGAAAAAGSSSSRGKRHQDPATSPRCAATGGGGSSSQKPRSLPVISSLPAAFADNGGPITNATVQLVLDVGAPMPALPVPALPLRRVSASLVPAEPKDGKRKRRPPGWLDGHDQGGEDHHSDEESQPAAAAAPVATKRKRSSSSAVPVVHATLVDGKHSSAGADSGSPHCVVTILGIASHSVGGGRAERSPHEPTPPNPASSERSPRPRSSSEPSSARKERESGGDDAFQVFFGDLPSPRMIEVVKAKEVQLPSWRVLPKRDASLGRGARNASAADAADGDSSEDDTSDEIFERRHNLALERAVVAAKEWAAEMAQKERQKSGGAQVKPNGEAGETGEEWRFRPSELAALCYAASKGIGSGGGDASSAGRGNSFAGFFGSGGANRGAGPDNRDAGDGGAANGDGANGTAATNGEATSGGGSGGGSSGDDAEGPNEVDSAPAASAPPAEAPATGAPPAEARVADA